METLTQRLGALAADQEVVGTLVLTIEQRERSRFRAMLDNGEVID